MENKIANNDNNNINYEKVSINSRVCMEIIISYMYIKNKIHEILGLITLKQLILCTRVFVVSN